MNFQDYLSPAEAKILAAISRGYQCLPGPFNKEGGVTRAWTPYEIIVYGARTLMNVNEGGKKFFFQELKYNHENSSWVPRNFEMKGDKPTPVSKLSPAEKKQANEILDAILGWDEKILDDICNDQKTKSFFAKLGMKPTVNRVSMDNQTVQEGISAAGVFDEKPEAMAELRKPDDAVQKMYDNAMSDDVTLEQLEKQINNDVRSLNDQINATSKDKREPLVAKRDKLIAMLNDKKRSMPANAL